MPKIAGIIICPNCASKNILCLGHGGYKQGKNSFGDKATMIGYQCQNCKETWSE